MKEVKGRGAVQKLNGKVRKVRDCFSPEKSEDRVFFTLSHCFFEFENRPSGYQGDQANYDLLGSTNLFIFFLGQSNEQRCDQIFFFHTLFHSRLVVSRVNSGC